MANRRVKTKAKKPQATKAVLWLLNRLARGPATINVLYPKWTGPRGLQGLQAVMLSAERHGWICEGSRRRWMLTEAGQKVRDGALAQLEAGKAP